MPELGIGSLTMEIRPDDVADILQPSWTMM
jgi:hypothetical protein